MTDNNRPTLGRPPVAFDRRPRRTPLAMAVSPGEEERFMALPGKTKPARLVWMMALAETALELWPGSTGPQLVERLREMRQVQHTCLCGDAIPADEYRCINCQAQEETR